MSNLHNWTSVIYDNWTELGECSEDHSGLRTRAPPGRLLSPRTGRVSSESWPGPLAERNLRSALIKILTSTTQLLLPLPPSHPFLTSLHPYPHPLFSPPRYFGKPSAVWLCFIFVRREPQWILLCALDPALINTTGKGWIKGTGKEETMLAMGAVGQNQVPVLVMSGKYWATQQWAPSPNSSLSLQTL